MNLPLPYPLNICFIISNFKVRVCCILECATYHDNSFIEH